MQKVEKLAVFDLDGTLWKINSHYQILNDYFNTHFFTSFFFRLFCHFFRKKGYDYICKKYEEIPKSYVSVWKPDFDNNTIGLLNHKKEEGYFCLIVSNAPFEIVENAATRLNLPFLRASIGNKKKTLDAEYKYTELFVCTDNIEDIDLIRASSSYKIMYKKNNIQYFKKEGFYQEDKI